MWISHFLCPTKTSTVQHDEALYKLANAEVQVEELKMQLDDALGAEEMLVQLTERNLMLGEVRRQQLLRELHSCGLLRRKSKRCASQSRTSRHSRS